MPVQMVLPESDLSLDLSGNGYPSDKGWSPFLGSKACPCSFLSNRK